MIPTIGLVSELVEVSTGGLLIHRNKGIEWEAMRDSRSSFLVFGLAGIRINGVHSLQSIVVSITLFFTLIPPVQHTKRFFVSHPIYSYNVSDLRRIYSLQNDQLGCVFYLETETPEDLLLLYKYF